ncbi:MAG TPA: DUF1080 domain-containing protein, partial [Gemmataceae bacterium]|nr:DUF1080 domain-containing protein [Gemmataceae bacterium]
MRTLRFGVVVPAAVLAGLGLLLAAPAADDKKEEGSAKPPQGAEVLFNGKDLDGWESLGHKPAEWKVEDGYMEVVPGKGNIMTEKKFGPDFQLHVDFWLPLMPDAKGQERANSGVFLQGRYEIQVLDSYMNDTYEKGGVGALYSILEPDHEAMKKAVKPPEQWQTYDITFHAPRVDDQGTVKESGRVTVALNGVTIIDDGKFDKYTPGEIDTKLGEMGPLVLQDHGCKVRYRNIWLKPIEAK